MSFQGFNVSESTAEDFNVPMGGAGFLDNGRHDVSITGVELDVTKQAGVPFIKITWEAANCKTHSERIYPNTKAGKPSVQFLRLLGLIEEGVRLPYFKDYLLPKASQDPKRFGSLVGLQATIVLGDAEEGFDIARNDLGGFFLVDVGNGRKVIDKEVFPTRKEAAAHGRELGMYRAFPEIKNIIGREVAANTEIVRKVLAPE